MGMDSDWQVQLNLKDWPLPGALVNVRAPSAASAAAHYAELAEFTNEIRQATDKMLAIRTMGQQFPETERVQPQQQQPYAQQAQQQGNSCAVHNLPRTYKSGAKNGKRWAGQFCTAAQNPCAVEWVE